MKICLFELEKWEHKAFEAIDLTHDVVYQNALLNRETSCAYRDAEIISTFIYSELTADVLKQMPKLKLIATRSTGFDHIDQAYCEAHNIQIANVPTYGANTVAEHVFALLLTISHRLLEATDRTRRGDFSSQGLQGFDLYGKTIGVVGTGSIGRHVVNIAQGFSMDVVAHDINPDMSFAAEKKIQYVSLEELLECSDIVTLHVPLNTETHHLIGATEIAKMRHGSVLINTARGDVVDVTALVLALAAGKVAAAGLDVLPGEPIIREEAELLRRIFTKAHDMDTLIADQILLHMRNVVITPHSAFNTKEAAQRIIDVTAENISNFLDGTPTNIVSAP